MAEPENWRGLIEEVLVDLQDSFSELDDTEEPKFGEYARVQEWDENSFDVLHATEDWGIRITVEPIQWRGRGTDEA